jgi:hypothetical protein
VKSERDGVRQRQRQRQRGGRERLLKVLILFELSSVDLFGDGGDLAVGKLACLGHIVQLIDEPL